MNEEMNNAGTINDNGEPKQEKRIDEGAAYERKRDKENEATEEESFDYETKLKALKISRENDMEYRKVWQGYLEELETKHKEMLTSMQENQDAIIKIEDFIKANALAEYDADESKNKKLAFGIGIRVMKDVLFDDELALEWAKSTGICLQLDRSGFKKIAKVQDINFVTITDRAIATIPTRIEV